MQIRIKNVNRLLAVLEKRRKDSEGDSIAIRTALTRVGLLVIAKAKLNIREHGLIDTGRLLNSLRFEFFRDSQSQGIRIGSFGVPYAAFWEFGFKGIQNIRGHNRLITRAFGRTLKSSVVASVKPHSRSVNQPAKDYLRPAYKFYKDKINQILIEAFNGL